MAKYQDNAKERFKKGLRTMSNMVERGIERSYNEADTRKIVSKILTEYLGWDDFENITAEKRINSRYADYIVKKDGNEIFVIEVKQIGIKLKEQHLSQARQYAIDEGIEWLVLTNGDEWKVYKQLNEGGGKLPETVHVFTVIISDKSMKPSQKAELMYLLSEEASRKSEIEVHYEKHNALSPQSLSEIIFSKDVLDKIRISIKNDKGVKLDNDDIANAISRNLMCNSVDSDVVSSSLATAKRKDARKNK